MAESNEPFSLFPLPAVKYFGETQGEGLYGTADVANMTFTKSTSNDEKLVKTNGSSEIFRGHLSVLEFGGSRLERECLVVFCLCTAPLQDSCAARSPWSAPFDKSWTAMDIADRSAFT